MAGQCSSGSGGGSSGGSGCSGAAAAAGEDGVELGKEKVTCFLLLLLPTWFSQASAQVHCVRTPRHQQDSHACLQAQQQCT